MQKLFLAALCAALLIGPTQAQTSGPTSGTISATVTGFDVSSARDENSKPSGHVWLTVSAEIPNLQKVSISCGLTREEATQLGLTSTSEVKVDWRLEDERNYYFYPFTLADEPFCQ